MWRLTMFSHWTSSLWLTFTIWCLCFGLLTASERPVHCLYGGGGTFQNNYIMPEYYQKGFSPTMVKDSFLVICLKFFTQTFGIFHTKPKLLISWYYLWVQISKAAQLLSVICKFQLPCLDHFFLPSRLKNCAKQLKDIPWLCTKHLSLDSVMKIDRMFFFFQLRKMKSTVESVIQTISKKKEGGEKQMRDC